MDDARLERLLTKPQGPRPPKPRRVANDLRDLLEMEGPSPADMLRTRPKAKAVRPRAVMMGANGRPIPEHGDLRRYKNQGCRCEKCKATMRRESSTRRAA